MLLSPSLLLLPLAGLAASFSPLPSSLWKPWDSRGQTSQKVHLRQINTVVSKAIDVFSADEGDDTPLPLVIWHGLGDSFDGEGLTQVAELAEAANPGTLVYVVHIGDDANADRSATFFGNVSAQLEGVCSALAQHPILSTAPAIDAMGFSQGGQFLRGYVERCTGARGAAGAPAAADSGSSSSAGAAPPVRSLVTFGSQHNGISEFKQCGGSDWLCKGAMALLRFNTWSDFVQSRLVPAQYYRDPAPSEYERYLESSAFLADINNERELKDTTYADNIAGLDAFVMYKFADDTTVVPRETAWFEEVNGTEAIPLRARELYREDWLGLQRLDRKGGLFFRTVPDADHMQISEEVLNNTMREFFGPYSRRRSEVVDFPSEL